MNMNTFNINVARQSEGFIATQYWYKHMFGIIYTDGVKWLANELNCYWLIDDIALYSNALRKKEGFLTCEFKTPNRGEGWLYFTDGDNTVLKETYYSFTDLFIDESTLEPDEAVIRFFLIFDGSFNKHVLLMPSEY